MSSQNSISSLFVIFFISISLLACGSGEPESMDTSSSDASVSEQINTLIAADQYAEALELLEGFEESEEVLKLKEMTHLNYGLFLEYRDSNVTNMRDKMNNALREYVKVLRINPNNEKAITEIEQILGIYATFGNRTPDEDVTSDLKELGFSL
jgi:tetratricopeptide (TPR) repeat protein